MSAPRLTRQHLALSLGLLAVVVALLVVAPAGALMLSPAVVLLGLIGLGLLPADEIIWRVRRMLRRARRVADRPEPVPAEPTLRRGLTALAFALAVRPPPVRA